MLSPKFKKTAFTSLVCLSFVSSSYLYLQTQSSDYSQAVSNVTIESEYEEEVSSTLPDVRIIKTLSEKVIDIITISK